MSNIEKTQPIHPLRQRMIEDMPLRRAAIAQARDLPADRIPPPEPVPEPAPATEIPPPAPPPGPAPCPCCGGRMILAERVTPAAQLRRRPKARMDSS